MGISVTGYSNVIIKPVPEKYRATVTQKNRLDIKQINDSLAKCDPKDRAGLLAFIMVSTGAENFLLNSDVEDSIQQAPDVKVSDEAYSWMDSEEDLIHVDWETNRCFYESEESKSMQLSRSYSGMSEFTKSIAKINNVKFFFPCDGILEGEILDKYFTILKETWPVWIKLHGEQKHHDKPIEEVVNSMEEDELDYDVYNYLQLYLILKYANDCGMIICS